MALPHIHAASCRRSGFRSTAARRVTRFICCVPINAVAGRPIAKNPVVYIAWRDAGPRPSSLRIPWQHAATLQGGVCFLRTGTPHPPRPPQKENVPRFARGARYRIFLEDQTCSGRQH